MKTFSSHFHAINPENLLNCCEIARHRNEKGPISTELLTECARNNDAKTINGEIGGKETKRH